MNPSTLKAEPTVNQTRSKLLPVLAGCAALLALGVGGFGYLNHSSPLFGQQSATPKVETADAAQRSALPSSDGVPLESRLAMPQRVGGHAQHLPPAADPSASLASQQQLVATAAAADDVVSAEDQAEAEHLSAVAKTPSPTETITTSIEMPAIADKSVDAYHNRLQQQLYDEYGLSGGQWVLTPNEFALISSVVTYGQKVTQDETTDKEDFGRLVRMHIAGKGEQPWDSGLYIPEIRGIEKGDRVLVVVWLRTGPQSPTEEGKVGIFVESASDHKKEVYLTVKPNDKWRQFLIPFQAKVARDLRLGFHLAFQKQTIDYGGLTLINFGKTAPFWNAIPAGPRKRSSTQ